MTNPHILHRTGALDTSIAAAYSVDTTKLESMVLNDIAKCGDGCIADDILALHPHHPYSSITARFSALIAKGLIHRTSERRKGRSGRNQSVMRVGPGKETETSIKGGSQ